MAEKKREKLSVLPKGKIYSFPFVVGLDSYDYQFGRHMAQRALGRRPSEALATSKPLPKSSLLQAGNTGSAAILWHEGTAATDSGAAVRKRRLKLTEDLLHDLVVTHQDPVDLVHQWFRIFQHFSDVPQEVLLPKMPEDVAVEVKPKVVAPEAESKLKSKSSVRRAPCLKRPEIVRVEKKVCKDDFEAARNDLQKTRNLLKDAGLAGAGAGQLDLSYRLKAQSLTDDSFSAWLESFKFLWHLQRQKSGLLMPQGRRQGRHRTATSRYMAKLNEKVNNAWDVFQEDAVVPMESSATSSATLESESEALEAPSSVADLTLSQVMLRSSSLAILKSRLVRNKAREEVKSKAEEVARSRAEILKGIAPCEMTLLNFQAFLQVFGVQRREVVERIARQLFCAPREAEEEATETLHRSSTLPFRIFYTFVRSLRSHDLQDYICSELLCRLVFVALTGHESLSHTAAARFHDDAMAKPLSVPALCHSLRLLIDEEEVQAVAESLFALLLQSQVKPSRRGVGSK